jgi:hypothetical protein
MAGDCPMSLRQSIGGQEPWLQELGEYLLAHGAGGQEEVHGIIDRCPAPGPLAVGPRRSLHATATKRTQESLHDFRLLSSPSHEPADRDHGPVGDSV